MSLKELPETVSKKPRSADVHRSFKDLAATLKSNFDHFLTALQRPFEESATAKPQFSAAASTLEAIKSSLDAMRFSQRLKVVRENPALLSSVVEFVNSLCEKLQAGSGDSQAKDETMLMYGYAFGLLTVIGKSLSNTIVGDSHIFEPTIKTLSKLGGMGSFLEVLTTYRKILQLHKANLYLPMDQKLKELCSSLFPTYASLLNALLQRANEELSLIHICRCRRYAVCRSRWSPDH
eukprot:TRINITY_DN11567_c0_g3_i1.p1 TRINITY_DN11567_c0_g3~~TRINITY_DN11567_c0_g3_i1.p1  ORF type:complete len:235 (+),score=44.45 TRINITY_DN11567_c0_g3_i1:160-864(+)